MLLQYCDSLRLKHSNIKWALLKIHDRKTIMVDRLSKCNVFDKGFQNDRDEFLTLKGTLDIKEPRYIIYNFTNTQTCKEQLAFIYW